MKSTELDTRSEERKRLDEAIANEPMKPLPEIDPSVRGRQIEEFLKEHRTQPAAIFGVVENGVVRPLDPKVRMPENLRVMIVAMDH